MKNTSRLIIVLLSLTLIVGILWYFKSIVQYVIIAWVLSLLGRPFMSLYRKIKVGKFQVGENLASAMTLISFLIIIVTVFSLFAPLVVSQARALAQVDYFAIGQSLEEPIEQLNQNLIRIGLLSPERKSPIETFRDDFLTQVGDYFSALFNSVLSITTSLFIGLFSIVFITFFFLKDEGLVLNFLYALVPNEQEEKISKVLNEIQHLLTRYFTGILFQITTITIIVSIGLTVVGVKNAILIGFFAGLINVIPYLGPIIGAVFGIIVTIASNLEMDFYTQLLPLIGWVTVIFAIMQLTDNFVLQPLIFSTSVKAHPLEIFIVILVGAELYGILGMVLAIPTYTVFRVVARTFLIRFKVVQQLTKRMNPPA